MIISKYNLGTCINDKKNWSEQDINIPKNTTFWFHFKLALRPWKSLMVTETGPKVEVIIV